MTSMLAGMLERAASQPFLIDVARGETLSFAQVGRRASHLARQLDGLGLKRGDRVAVSLPNGSDFAVFYFACLLGRFTAVPVNSALLSKDREFILARTGLSAYVVQAASHQAMQVVSVRTLTLDLSGGKADLSSGEADDVELARRAADVEGSDLFSIHFTSGTTSFPKGVPHRVDVLLGNVASFNRMFGLGRERRFVHVMPMDYMAGFLNTLLGAWMAEAPIILGPQFSAASSLRFWEPVIAYGGDTIWMSPTMLATLLRTDRGEEGARYCSRRDVRIFSATAPLPQGLRKEFATRYGTDPIESYGLSELLLITANDGPAGRKDGSVGRALPEAEIEIRDDVGRPIGRNADGGIHVRTPFCSVGYLDMDTGQPQPSESSWFDTGDLGHIDDDGYLFVTGRRKDLIIRGGFNVSPRQIEETLLRHPMVENAAVIGAPHDYYGEEIVAAVIPKPGSELSTFEADLRQLCRRELAARAVPDRFVSFSDFPVTQTGKVQKAKVRDAVIQGGGG